MKQSGAQLLPLMILLLTHITLGFEIGSCSRSCRQNSDRFLQNSIPAHKCYCSSGCAKFGDCCYDSKHRATSEDSLVEKSQEMCFSVEGKGTFRAISECPEGEEGLHPTMPLVTSLDTYLTYANHKCAECHNDSRHLLTWKAELRCCKRRLVNIYLKETGDQGYKSYFQRRKSGSICSCRFNMTDEAFLEVGHLDLRACENESKLISKCGSNDDEQSDCSSYEDPVFVDDVLYKNSHCAMCNVQSLETVTCITDSFTRNQTVLQDCQELGVVGCYEKISVRGVSKRPGILFRPGQPKCRIGRGKITC